MPNTTSTRDPLAALLRVAVRRAADPSVRTWLQRLLRRGEATNSTAARKAAAPTAAAAGEVVG